MKRLFSIIFTASLFAFNLAPAANAADPNKFKNCSALNKVYPGGVAKTGGKDLTKKKGKLVPAKPKKSPVINDAIYSANPKLDKDKDGVACEK